MLKQQKLEGPLTTEAVESLSSEDMDLMDEESSRKSAKVLQPDMLSFNEQVYYTDDDVH